MNHPSEWTRFYDRGHYRYRHKGTGVVRDTLLSIGKRFAKSGKKKAEEAAKKAAEKVAEKAAEKAVETTKKVAERGAEKIQQVLKRKKTLPPDSRKKSTVKKGLNQTSRQKLENILKKKEATMEKGLNQTSRQKLENILKRKAEMKVNRIISEN